MSSPAGIGQRLRQAREQAGFTQKEAADAIGIPRELISYWEHERRIPGLARLNQLAETYGSTTDYLLGEGHAPTLTDERALLYRELRADAPRTRAGVQRWLTFLDAWANVLEEAGDELPGRGHPPVKDWAQPHPITDSRLAERLALEVREHYRLGLDAIPDLVTFLDQSGVLVYQAPFEQVDEPGNISGIFYNHPRLGYAILVNTSATGGRQAFTMAHEFAHALFHYQEISLVSRTGERAGTERFADAFAAHFLVPSVMLRELIRRHFQGHIASPDDVVRLQRSFQVSYAVILNRLLDDQFLSPDRYRAYQGYSPKALATRLGIEAYPSQTASIAAGSLGCFPPSVLDRVRRLIEGDELSPAAAASLLNVAQEAVLARLLTNPPRATNDERREFRELPQPDRSRATVRS